MREAIKFIKENLKGHLMGAEVGVGSGEHAKQILDYLDCKLYLIDIWDYYKESNIVHSLPKLTKSRVTKEWVEKKLKDYDVEILKEDSIEASKRFKDGFFDFVYIDANHKFNAVIQDLIYWSRKVRKGGIVSGHDYYEKYQRHVMNAVNAYTYDHKKERWFITDRKSEQKACNSFFWEK